MKVRRVNPETRREWEPTSYSVLCSEHFKSDDFEVTLTRRRLKLTAIPTVFSYSVQPKERRPPHACGRAADASSEETIAQAASVAVASVTQVPSADTEVVVSAEGAVLAIEPLEPESLIVPDITHQASLMKD